MSACYCFCACFLFLFFFCFCILRKYYCTRHYFITSFIRHRLDDLPPRRSDGSDCVARNQHCPHSVACARNRRLDRWVSPQPARTRACAC